MNLTTHFSLEELTVSQTAARRGIDNTPSPEVFQNLKLLAVTLERVRELFASPVLISSGYRSPLLNKMVGGGKGSAHMSGLAVDFTIPSWGPPLAIAKRIAESTLSFDQLIHEYGSWVHLGLSGEMLRRQLLTIDRLGTRVGLLEVRK